MELVTRAEFSIPPETLRKSFQDHSSPLPLNPGIPKDICHIPMPLSTQRNISLSESPTRPHPNPIPFPPPRESPTSCPSLSHATSGAGKPFVSHSSLRGCPARPDTLVMRPSSRMLGGT